MNRYTIDSRAGLAIDIVDLGAAITAITIEDRDGTPVNVVTTGPPHAGATMGRYANRIAGAQITLEGRTYALTANDGPHTLHGGSAGFDRAVWKLEEIRGEQLSFSISSPAGEQGFPGNLRVLVTFTAQGDTLRIAYVARSDADTVINLTNHAYFNLSGTAHAPASQHVLQVFADGYAPADTQLIPTGEIAPVEKTRYDFRTPRTIGQQPYDTDWVLRREEPGLVQAAILGDPQSGRMLEVLTTEPALHVFTGDDRGVALETEHLPDSPNKPAFPSTMLRAGERFTSTTLYRFPAT